MVGYKLGILGCGNMGGAILEGIIENKLITGKKVAVYDVSDAAMDKYVSKFEVTPLENEIKLYEESEYLLVAIKPQYLKAFLQKIKDSVQSSEISDTVVISIAAGQKLSLFEEYLGENTPIIRVMPNLLALVKSSASALTPNEKVSPKQFEFVFSMFDGIGTAVKVKENLMDVVTGLSGSGPAYVAMFIESLADGAVKLGLPRDIAYKLAAQTVSGTGKLVLDKNLHPGVLKDMVCSPGGTTIAAVHALEQNNFRNATINAVIASAEKSKELGKK